MTTTSLHTASSDATAHPPGAVAAENVERLRLVVARLARLLRQQDDSGLGPTITAALSTINKHGPLTLGDLAARERVAPPTITKVVDKMEARRARAAPAARRGPPRQPRGGHRARSIAARRVPQPAQRLAQRPARRAGRRRPGAARRSHRPCSSASSTSRTRSSSVGPEPTPPMAAALREPHPRGDPRHVQLVPASATSACSSAASSSPRSATG